MGGEDGEGGDGGEERRERKEEEERGRGMMCVGRGRVPIVHVNIGG